MSVIKMMTIWPAWQHFEEKTKGSIEVGKLADLVILDQDPTRIDLDQLDQLDQIQILETIKEGVTVFALKNRSQAKTHQLDQQRDRASDAFTNTLMAISGVRATLTRGRFEPSNLSSAMGPRLRLLCLRDFELAGGDSSQRERAIGKPNSPMRMTKSANPSKLHKLSIWVDANAKSHGLVRLGQRISAPLLTGRSGKQVTFGKVATHLPTLIRLSKSKMRLLIGVSLVRLNWSPNFRIASACVG